MREYVISSLEANQRLDRYLLKFLKKAGKGYLYKMLRKRSITLNGKKAKGSDYIKKGDIVRLYMTDETIEEMMGLAAEDSPAMAEYKRAYEKLKNRVKIIHEDENVLIINKPVGVLAQKSLPNDYSVNEWLIGYMMHTKQITVQQLHTFKPSICNRLDKYTSGLMICGKTLLGSQTMNELIRTRQVRKFYRTLVKGEFKEPMHVQGYLTRDFLKNKVYVSDKEMPDSEYIETAMTPLKTSSKYSYIEVELITGKHHQIRAHLASIGHPILGDYKYGDHRFNEMTTVKFQFLHAYRLEFPRLTGEFIELCRAKVVANEPRYIVKFKERMEE